MSKKKNAPENQLEDTSLRDELLEKLKDAQDYLNSLENSLTSEEDKDLDRNIVEAKKRVSNIIAQLMIENSKETLAEQYLSRQQAFKRAREALEKERLESEQYKKESEETTKKMKEKLQENLSGDFQNVDRFYKSESQVAIREVKTWIAHENLLTHKFLVEAFSKDKEMFDRHLQRVRTKIEKNILNENIEEEASDGFGHTIETVNSVSGDRNNILQLPAPVVDAVEEKVGLFQRIRNWLNRLFS